jgi:hypothetical protein
MKIIFKPQKYTLVLTFFLMTVFIGSVTSQVTQEWAVEYPGLTPVDIAVDDLGNVYTAGWELVLGPSYDIIIVKYNASGDSIWSVIYNNPNMLDVHLVKMELDNANNIYLAGTVEFVGAIGDYWTIKYNSSGQFQWERFYDHWSDDVLYDMGVAPNGDVYVTGESFGTAGGTGFDYLTIKYGALGDTAWISRYEGYQTAETAHALVLNNSGSVIVTGSRAINNIGYDFLTIQYDCYLGGPGWSEVWGDSGISEIPYDIAIDQFDNVYVGGNTEDVFVPIPDNILVVKYNSTGVLQWTNTYNGPGDSTDALVAIACDSMENLYALGYTCNKSTRTDFCLIKYNANGIQEWVRTFDGTSLNWEEDKPTDIVLDNYGNILITGTAYNSPTSTDITTIKYDPAGNVLWTASYGDSIGAHEYGAVISLDQSGNIYVLGRYDYGGYPNNGSVLLKYSQTTSIEDESLKHQVSNFRLSQNYPNPFNPTTKIKFRIPPGFAASPFAKGGTQGGFVSLKVYDVLGNEVATLVNEELPAGDYEVEFGDNGLTSGVYFYQLRVYPAGGGAGSFIQTKKMIFLK